MSETTKWSFSTDRCLRRCQRQYFLQNVAAWHNARDDVRREAFLGKQVKTLELWQGSLVHRGIELFVVPAIQQRRPVDWHAAVAGTVAMATRQFEFSRAHRYREAGMSKAKAKDDYCALEGHEFAAGVSEQDVQRVLDTVDRSFRGLAGMAELLQEIQTANRLWPELMLHVGYDAARIEVRLDLLYFRSFGKPTIVDWKVSESMGGSDADLQTALYAWALCRHPQWRVERAEDCELVEVQLLTQEVIRHRATDELFDRLENRIFRSVDSIQSLRLGRTYDLEHLDDYDFARNPNSCSYCPQRRLCRELTTRAGAAPAVSDLRRVQTKKKERNRANSSPQLF